MKYDFDSVVDRRGTGSLKWDIAEGELPMWVADMDFKTAPEILEALEARTRHGVFGYSDVTDDWYDAYIESWRRRHGFEIKREWLMFCTGVVPAISSTVRKLTTPNENVIVMSPVYNIFFNSIVNNGCRVLESQLSYQNGRFDIDFADLERRLSDPQTTLMILCNPHNPVGRIWSADELGRIGELCKKHCVTVISDEIHCDITLPGIGYTPFASVSDTCREISVSCIAPTKAFNLAGLQTSAIFVPNEGLRNRVRRAINTDEVAEPNAFAVTAAVAALTRGGEWLDELREYVAENKRTAHGFIGEKIPCVGSCVSQATYLMWLDCSGFCGRSDELAEFIRRKTGLYLSDGVQYGGSGSGFLRLNVACPRSVLMDGLERLRTGVYAYIESGRSSLKD